MKVAFFDARSYDHPAFEAYGKLHRIDFRFFEVKLDASTARLAAGCEAVCIFVNDTADREVLDILYEEGVRFLLLRCAGYNNVDLSAAFGRIHVAHVPGYSPEAVAEHAMAMLLTSVRRIHKAYNRTRDYNFSLAGLEGFNLHGKTVGIIGTGRIGRAFADICHGFGMKVLGYDKFPVENAGIEYHPLGELFRDCDILSVHCPLTEETRHMINRESIAAMKKGVILINTSRGALIDAEALVEGIKDRKIGAALLDVYEEEADIFYEDHSGHIVDDDTLARLISMPNVIVTSHQAFLTREALDEIARVTTDNLLSLIKDGTCSNELCYRCGKQGNCRDKRTRCF